MSECINHTGAITDGYGVKKHKGKTVRAHRLAYCKANNLEVSDIAGSVIMHTCDNRLCINPDHLKTGTHADNCADKVSKGRQARGETSGNSVLKNEEVLRIKELIQSDYSATRIAPMYGVSVMCISRIRSGKTWRHL